MTVVAWWVVISIAASAVIVCAREIDRYLSRRARRKLHESVRRHPAGTRPVTVDDQHWWEHVDQAIAMAHDDENADLIAELDLRLLARKFSAQEVDDARLHSWMENGR